MADVETAHVETLTAEVRVLMVGNRQITLSVARQLDVLPLEVVEPFGRVELGTVSRGYYKMDGPWVIGRDRGNGALVVAEFIVGMASETFLGPGDLDGPLIVCDRTLRGSSTGYVDLTWRGHTLRADRRVLQGCGMHPHSSAYGPAGPTGPPCPSWNPNGQDDAIAEEVAAQDREAAQHRRAASLPLIVLAGLR